MLFPNSGQDNNVADWSKIILSFVILCKKTSVSEDQMEKNIFDNFYFGILSYQDLLALNGKKIRVQREDDKENARVKIVGCSSEGERNSYLPGERKRKRVVFYSYECSLQGIIKRKKKDNKKKKQVNVIVGCGKINIQGENRKMYLPKVVPMNRINKESKQSLNKINEVKCTNAVEDLAMKNIERGAKRDMCRLHA